MLRLLSRIVQQNQPFIDKIRNKYKEVHADLDVEDMSTEGDMNLNIKDFALQNLVLSEYSSIHC